MNGTTETRIRVTLRAEAKCPECLKTIELTQELAEEQLTTGNTTQMATYWAKTMRATVDAAKRAELWDGERCGSCRVRAGEEANKCAVADVPSVQ